MSDCLNVLTDEVVLEIENESEMVTGVMDEDPGRAGVGDHVWTNVTVKTVKTVKCIRTVRTEVRTGVSGVLHNEDDIVVGAIEHHDLEAGIGDLGRESGIHSEGEGTNTVCHNMDDETDDHHEPVEGESGGDKNAETDVQHKPAVGESGGEIASQVEGIEFDQDQPGS